MNHDAHPPHRKLTGFLLRAILLAVLCGLAAVLLLAIEASSPYDPNAAAHLRSALFAYAILNVVFVWKVKSVERYIALLALVVAAAAYVWRMGL